jgi:hypothetical protein
MSKEYMGTFSRYSIPVPYIDLQHGGKFSARVKFEMRTVSQVPIVVLFVVDRHEVPTNLRNDCGNADPEKR